MKAQHPKTINRRVCCVLCNFSLFKSILVVLADFFLPITRKISILVPILLPKLYMNMAIAKILKVINSLRTYLTNLTEYLNFYNLIEK